MTAQQFADLIQEAGFDTRSYSGRSMYGKSCLAFECENGQELGAVAQIVAAVASWNSDEMDVVVAAFKRAKTDSMGRSGLVVYFPSIEYSAPARPYEPEEVEE